MLLGFGARRQSWIGSDAPTAQPRLRLNSFLRHIRLRRGLCILQEDATDVRGNAGLRHAGGVAAPSS
jgi:hypothetical protein